LQLTPMIDCVFLLMVYFLWSSSFAVAELSLPGRISTSGGGAASARVPPPEADFDNIVIRITTAGGQAAWSMNGAPLGSLPELAQALAAVARIKRDAPVVLDADGEVPLGDVIDAYDAARLAGLARVQFAASFSTP
jgi:biopolymer transport protein ExbD